MSDYILSTILNMADTHKNLTLKIFSDQLFSDLLSCLVQFF